MRQRLRQRARAPADYSDIRANDLRHVACIVTKMDSSIDSKKHIAELLRKERYWEPDVAGESRKVS